MRILRADEGPLCLNRSIGSRCRRGDLVLGYRKTWSHPECRLTLQNEVDAPMNASGTYTWP